MPSPLVVTAAQARAALRDALAAGPAITVIPADDDGRVRAAVRPELDLETTDAAAVVTTSGSTGAAKAVVLSRAAITASVEATHARLGGPGSWTLALPAHYVAGIMVIARAVVADTALHRLGADLRGDAPLPGPVGRHYLSVVPTQLARGLVDPELLDRLRRYHAVLVGGGATDPDLLDRARAAGIAAVTTYGMAETCGGCVYDGHPLDGVDVALDPGTDRVRVAGPMLFSGYRCDPDATAAVLADGWFTTADRGRWDDDRLTLLGRVDDVVVSGGANVDLAAVERAVVAEVAGRGEAAVVAVPDAEWGARVVAVSDVAITRDQLRARLSGPALPREVVVLDRLPHTTTGKIDRQALRERLAARPPHDGSDGGTR